MIGQWMAAGFVHGVMNTDNFNITGETFDFGPYRFCETSDPNFTAAYFDQQGLYRFGRQPGQGLWSLQQLAAALSHLSEVEDLAGALDSYEPAYQRSFASHTLALLGLLPKTLEEDLQFVATFYAWMTESKANWPQMFFDWFGGEASVDRAKESSQSHLYKELAFDPIRTLIEARDPCDIHRLSHAYFQRPTPVNMLYDVIENLWAPIADQDDWSAFQSQLAHIEQARLAMALDRSN